MVTFAEIILYPGGLVAWGLLRLIAGWLAGRVVGGGYGIVLDVVPGLVGALVGGFVFGLLQGSETAAWGIQGFWGSVLVAFLGACILLIGGRFMGMGLRLGPNGDGMPPAGARPAFESVYRAAAQGE